MSTLKRMTVMDKAWPAFCCGLIGAGLISFGMVGCGDDTPNNPPQPDPALNSARSDQVPPAPICPLVERSDQRCDGHWMTEWTDGCISGYTCVKIEPSVGVGRVVKAELVNTTRETLFLPGCRQLRVMVQNGEFWGPAGPEFFCVDNNATPLAPGDKRVISLPVRKNGQYRAQTLVGIGCALNAPVSEHTCTGGTFSLQSREVTVGPPSPERCEQLRGEYQVALGAARLCNRELPFMQQCTTRTPTDLACGACETFVNPSADLIAIKQQWDDANCHELFFAACTRLYCAPAQTGSCEAGVDGLDICVGR